MLDRIADKWSVLIIRRLSDGTLRFAQLRRAVDGISQKVLTELLRCMERDGLLSRHVLAPFRVEYQLTPIGMSLATLLEQIRAWADTHFKEVGVRRAAYDAEKNC